MDHTLAAMLDELHVQGREHDATKADRLDRLRNLEPETARVVSVLVRSRPAPVGTSASCTRGSAATSSRNGATSSAWETTLSTHSSPPGTTARSRSGQYSG